MRRSCFIIMLVGLILVESAPIFAQDNKRTFNPPTLKIEISGREPLPSGVTQAMTFAAGGGGSGESMSTEYAHDLYWEWPRDEQYLLYPGFPERSGLVLDFEGSFPFKVCGYRSNVSPLATLTLPDGQQPAVESTFASGCWFYELPWQFGSQTGIYRIDLVHQEGNVSRTWYIGYPLCPMAMKMNGLTVLMGFVPNQQIQLHFYRFLDQLGTKTEYLATRTVAVDATGTLALDVVATRSANVEPFGFDFVVTDTSRRLYNINWWAQSGSTSIALARPAPTNPNYQVEDQDCDGTFVYHLSDSPARFAQIATTDGNSLPLLAAFNDKSQSVSTLANGTPVEVLDQKPDFSQGQLEMWYQLRTEQGQEGWTYGQNMFRITPHRVRGASGYSGYGRGLELRDKSGFSANVKVIRQLSPKERFVIVYNSSGDGTLVELEDKARGWLWGIFIALPWLPTKTTESVDAPQISEVKLREEGTGADKVIYQDIHYVDPDGDTTHLYIDAVGGTKLVFETSAALNDVPQNKQIAGDIFTVAVKCSESALSLDLYKPFTVTLEAVVVDSQYSISNAAQYTVNCD